MIGRLGKHQLALLRSLAGSLTVIVADKTTRSLCARGLMVEQQEGAFVHVTPDGLRALADAAEQGFVRLGSQRPQPNNLSPCKGDTL